MKTTDNVPPASPHRLTGWWIWIVVPCVLLATVLCVCLGPLVLQEVVVRRLEPRVWSFVYTEDTTHARNPVYDWFRQTSGLRGLGNPLVEVWLDINEKNAGEPLKEVIKELRTLGVPLRVKFTHTGAITEDLKNLPLEWVCQIAIIDCDVPMEAVRTLQGMPKLIQLSLNDCRLNRQAFKELGPLSGLKVLELDQTSVIDEDVLELAKLTNLKLLSLSNTQVSDAAKEKLNKSLPNLEISDD